MLKYVSLLVRRFRPPLVPRPCVHDLFQQESVEQLVGPNNLIQNVKKITSIHPSELFSGVRVSDFSIDNLLAVGALDSLANPVHLSLGPLDSANAVSSGLPSVDSLMDSQVEVVTSQPDFQISNS